MGPAPSPEALPIAAFLDTNVILRYLLRDDEARFQRSFALIKRAESGEEGFTASDLVFAEVVWILENRPYRLPRDQIRDALVPLIRLRGLRLPDKGLLARALHVYADTGIDFIDAYNVAMMQRRGVDHIYSYDADFDRVPGITRLEP